MVFMDRLRRVPPTGKWPWPQSAHLCADTVRELHAFAAKIGCRREWFQPVSRPHYDLTPRRYQDALRAGAVVLGRRDFIARLRASVRPRAKAKVRA